MYCSIYYQQMISTRDHIWLLLSAFISKAAVFSSSIPKPSTDVKTIFLFVRSSEIHLNEIIDCTTLIGVMNEFFENKT